MDIVSIRKELLNGKSIYDLKLRVVNYDRVSTDKEEQLSSLKNQNHFFKDMILGIPNWIHVGSYEDEGISGTSALKRESFLKMIEDAKNGLFDMILTKEISRFARNTIDSIYYTQLLLSYGVVVFFLSDNINTIYSDSEFRLTLMASMAQDEVRKLSERVKFGIQRSIRDGKVLGSSLYGYRKEKGKMEIVPEEAEVVQKIFVLYATGRYSFLQLKSVFDREGIITRQGNLFSDTTLKKMIVNPRYKGWYSANLSEVVDYKSHKRVYHNKKDWIVFPDDSGNIPPIISEALWNEANRVYEMRKENRLFSREIPFSSKIICESDHHFYIRCASSRRKNIVWQCSSYVRGGRRCCDSFIIKEEKLLKWFQNYFLKKQEWIDSIFLEVAKSYEENGMDCDKIFSFLKNNYSLLDFIYLFVKRIVPLQKKPLKVLVEFYGFDSEIFFLK